MPIDHLPEKVQPAAYRVRAFLMTDSTALLLLAVVQTAVGLYYLPGALGDPLQWQRPVESIMPLTIWAGVHIAVGVLCLVAAFTHRTYLDVVGLALAIGLSISWAFSLLVGAVEYQQAVLWLVGVLTMSVTVSLMWAVWRGKRGDIPLEEKGEGV
ncbi:putative membrane protein [Corynebacterium phage LGCM-V6]|uniref:hypothetical protein n=1 Tax=Corynebacterium pseudotuberculosis TaxID=1719 RepID=UPI00065640BB|nr:hypothetical protein [Corynebacterium pseudotuberculosis]AQY55174.1 membrane protein [Corynebacterium phage LGCM-VI]ARM68578.1 putative membrane protein [Corynebacterium phage LGCM-V2]ARM68626.1 putative membrane protein [Corynebacterium phage LGCM-V3]ARM68675.1 putative membrane protein [Corynebacterium phage LGCM-V4]ARM68723.1 putative membrane protein [Corynebacterium phage LGCM-V6]ARM68771.1 putative membrane protein [Corynebacterium phage LGCM-V5]ARM68819.1 putative membrane protein 